MLGSLDLTQGFEKFLIMSTKPSLPRSTLRIQKSSSNFPKVETSREQFHRDTLWVHRQLDRINKPKGGPSVNELSQLAASLLGGGVENDETLAIRRALSLWNLTSLELKIRKTVPEESENIEGFKKMGKLARITPWPVKANGEPYKSCRLNRFLPLFIPLKNSSQRQEYYQRFLEENPGGERRTWAEAARVFKQHKGKNFTYQDYEDVKEIIVEWWMQQKTFNPLKFPKGSIGDVWKKQLLADEYKE